MGDFDFKWKLIENYFNALMVIVFSILIAYGVVYNDSTYLLLAVIGSVLGPFIATFIDKRSTEGKRK
jgi:hypothetical protein